MIPADKQTAFNRVWNHLRTQRKRAAAHGTCRYFLPDSGRKCAIGIFIPDGDPAQHSMANVFGLAARLFEPGADRPFLMRLQEAHDGAHLDKFRARLIRVAEVEGLRYPARGWAPGPR